MAIKQGRDSPSVMGVESVPPGKCITTNTVYNTYNGRPITQNISVTEPNGKVSVTNVINGKLLPRCTPSRITRDARATQSTQSQ